MRRFLLLAAAVFALLGTAVAQPSALAGDWVFRMNGDPTPQRVALVADGFLDQPVG